MDLRAEVKPLVVVSLQTSVLLLCTDLQVVIVRKPPAGRDNDDSGAGGNLQLVQVPVQMQRQWQPDRRHDYQHSNLLLPVFNQDTLSTLDSRFKLVRLVGSGGLALTTRRTCLTYIFPLFSSSSSIFFT